MSWQRQTFSSSLEILLSRVNNHLGVQTRRKQKWKQNKSKHHAITMEKPWRMQRKRKTSVKKWTQDKEKSLINSVTLAPMTTCAESQHKIYLHTVFLPSCTQEERVVTEEDTKHWGEAAVSVMSPGTGKSQLWLSGRRPLAPSTTQMSYLWL